MTAGSFHALASVDAVRPVFMIVMGVFLMLVVWRLADNSEGWAARMMVAGAILLGFGYALVVPLYEAGKIERYYPGTPMHDPATALAWHAVKLVVMNSGWLVFGLGLGIHSGLLRMPIVRRVERARTVGGNESIA